MDNETNKKLGQLIVSIAKGNVEAINEIYVMLGRVMYSVARVNVKKTAEVEDIVHESLLKIVSRAHKFRENRNAYAWINTIVKNTATDFSRRCRYREECAICVESVYELDDSGIIVWEVLRILTEKEQDVIVYYYWYGMSFSEIAKVLHISKSAVKRRIDRALEKIKKFYET